MRGTRRSRSTSKASIRSANCRPTSMPGKSTPPKPSRKSSRAALPRPTPSEAAFERAFAALDDPAPVPKKPSSPERPALVERDAFVERVFAAGESYLRDPYSTIGDASIFNSKLVGVSFEGRQDVISGLAGRQRTRTRATARQSVRRQRHRRTLRQPASRLHSSRNRRPPGAAHRRGRAYRARIASLTGGGEKIAA